MKKLVSLLSVIVIIFAVSVSVFAGDVPESLMYEDSAKVFIGTVEDFTFKSEISFSSQAGIDTVDVIPTEKIKGDVEIGVKETYTRCDSVLILEKGKEYLFGYFDENNFYIYEIKSRDENKIKLVNSDKFDMTKRFEDYLNDGSFERAEQLRLAKMGQTETSSVSVIGGADAPTDITVASPISLWAIVGVGALVLALVVLLLTRKKK